MAETILRRFPDYGKAPPHYLIAIVELIEGYPEHIQAAFADIKTGIAARCSYLPTIADFVKMAGEILAKEDREAETHKRIVDLSERVAELRARPAMPPLKSRERFYDRNNNEINPREAEERIAQHEREKDGIRRATEMTAYVKFLGNGDALAGWQIAIERGIQEPPVDWRSA